MTYSISISGVCERDIDLLLLEEFIASPPFLQWFSGQVEKTLPKVEKLLDAKRSVMQSNGESDLEILIQDSDGSQTCLLIENKINACFQPKQAERYQKRGQTYQQNGHCTSFYTLLVAPKRYFGSDTALRGFAARITYEEIRDWFNHQKRGERQRYKVALLTAAIEKGTVGYQAVEDACVTEFWYQYWQLTQTQAPTLNMKEPSFKPARSGFVLFSPIGLQPGVKLIHKLPHGNVDLQFSGMGKQINELRKQFESFAEADMSFERAAESGCIRLRVPPLNTAHEFNSQRQASLLGIGAAKRLLNWYEKYERTRGFLHTPQKGKFRIEPVESQFNQS